MCKRFQKLIDNKNQAVVNSSRLPGLIDALGVKGLKEVALEGNMVLVIIIPPHTPSLIRSISKDSRTLQDVLQTGLAKSRGVKGFGCGVKKKLDPGQNTM